MDSTHSKLISFAILTVSIIIVILIFEFVYKVRPYLCSGMEIEDFIRALSHINVPLRNFIMLACFATILIISFILNLKEEYIHAPGKTTVMLTMFFLTMAVFTASEAISIDAYDRSMKITICYFSLTCALFTSLYASMVIFLWKPSKFQNIA